MIIIYYHYQLSIIENVILRLREIIKIPRKVAYGKLNNILQTWKNWKNSGIIKILNDF